MWEIIRKNKIRSMILILVMAVILFVTGYVFGEAYYPGGGLAGVVIAFIVWVVLSLVSYFAGDSIALKVNNAKEIRKEDYPKLYNVVEEMKIAAALPAMPRVYIIDEESPNAFATGRDPAGSSVAVTSGLLRQLNRDELQGVVAHEVGHIFNRDILFITLAGTMVGAIVLISDIFLRGFRFGAQSRFRGSKKGGQIVAIMMIVAIVLAIIAPIIARLLYFATSRKREYLADATSARLTRFPAGLASALEKIAGSKIKFTAGNRAFAPMYITNPYEPGGLGVFNFASTHPPVYERIFILQNMAHGASYHDYQAAWRTIRKTSIAANLLPPSAVAMRESIPLRAPSEAEKADQRQRAKETGDLLRKLNNFMFIRCACGLTMKIPPEYSRESIVCPRCCLSNSVPVAEMAAVSAAGSSLSGISESPQVYKRKTKQWETFRCSCGHLLQLSPSFAAKEMTCPSCSKIIKME